MALHLCASSSRHGNIANTCSCAQIIHTHDAQTYTHTQSAHLCSISYLHATVALLTADETLAPFHTPPHFVPPPLFSLFDFSLYLLQWIAGSIALFSRRRAVYKTKRTSETDSASLSLSFLSPSSLKIQSGLHPRLVYPPILWLFCVFVCMCIFICVCLCACKLSRAHKDLHWHQTHSHSVLCLRSPKRCSV